MIVVGIVGGSGRWAGAIIDGQEFEAMRRAQGRNADFYGHVPDSARREGKTMEIIERQIRRQMSGGRDDVSVVKGGTKFSIEI